MSEGTRYFLLSMSTIWDPDTFSTITYRAVRSWQTVSVKKTKQTRLIKRKKKSVEKDFTYWDPVRVLVADFGRFYASMFCSITSNICIIFRTKDDSKNSSFDEIKFRLHLAIDSTDSCIF